LAVAIPGRISERLGHAAREANIYVAAGLTERVGDRLYNAAILVDPRGQIILKHHKITLLDIEQDLYSIGDRLGVVETPLGVIGLNICADNFPGSLVLGHALGCMGAQVLLSPSAWAVPAEHDPVTEPYGTLWEGSYCTLARSYRMPVIGVSNVGRITAGPWSGRKCIGCSLAVGSDGAVLAKGEYGVDAQQLIAIDVILPEKTGCQPCQ
jgi:predicted amidohydrolase